MKIVITGGTGFLGRHLVWHFSQNHQVVFTGRNTRAAEEVLAHCNSQAMKANAQFYALNHGDSSAQKIFNTICEGADVVIHNAALSSPWGRREAFISANITSTQEVIRAAEKNSVKRLIFISSPSLYFDYCDRVQVNEQEPLPKPVNEYARTKRLAELEVINSRIPEKVILRPRALFGPWDQTLMPRLVRVIEQGKFPLMRGGEALVDLTYIDNAVQAVQLSATRKLSAPCQIFNVSNGEPKRIRDLLTQVADEFNLQLRLKPVPWPIVKTIAYAAETFAKFNQYKEPAITRYSAGVLAFGQTLDITAIKHELGYAPTVSIDDGIKKHAKWYLSEGFAHD